LTGRLERSRIELSGNLRTQNAPLVYACCHPSLTTPFAVHGVRVWEFGVRRALRLASNGPHHHPNAEPKSIPNFVPSALQSMKILFSCEDFSEKSFASLINRARARPDFARPTSRPTPRQGAPKRSDGGVVLVLGKLSSPTEDDLVADFGVSRSNAPLLSASLW